MQVPIEPNLDKEIPVIAQPQRGDNEEQRMKIAANTAMALRELGLDDESTPEEEAQAKEMFERMKPERAPVGEDCMRGAENERPPNPPPPKRARPWPPLTRTSRRLPM